MAIPRPGTKLPEFTLKVANKDGVQDFALSQHLGKGPLVFAFYPLAFTKTCTKEMCDFRDNLARFEGLGAAAFGFSVDTPAVNVAYARSHELNLGIVCDPNREHINDIWETMTVAGVHNVAKRGAMVVGPDGVVKWSSVSDDPTVWIGTEEIAKHLA